MIRFIPHKRIDKGKWDHCLDHCSWSRIYAYSWYLDQVHPEWDALVYGAYEAVFPLPIRKKYGIAYLAQPPFCQQLGVFGEGEHWKKHSHDFLHALPQNIRWGHYQMNDQSSLNLSDNDSSKFQLKKRSNYELKLLPTYKELQLAYSSNTRRNVKKVQKYGFRVDPSLDPILLIQLKQRNEKTPIGPESYQILERIFALSIQKEKGTCIGVWDPEKNELLAAAFLLRGPYHLVYLLAASSERGREQRAMFLLVDWIIAQYAGRSLHLDFEGSDLPGLARFYEGFGAIDHPYSQIHLQRMPRWIMNTKNLIFPKK